MITKPIKSVSNPTAQNNTLCEPPIKCAIAPGENFHLTHLMNAEPVPVRVIVRLLVDYGLRISEILAIKPTDITADGRIIIKGSKRSSNRLVVCHEHKDFLINIRNGSYNYFAVYDRFQIYRILKKYNVVSLNQYGSKNAVCHQFRYKFVTDVNAVTNNIDSTALLIGHKSSSNTKKYLKDGK